MRAIKSFRILDGGWAGLGGAQIAVENIERAKLNLSDAFTVWLSLEREYLSCQFCRTLKCGVLAELHGCPSASKSTVQNFHYWDI